MASRSKAANGLTDGEPELRFSVVVPLYNKAHTIRRTLASVCSQTYPHFEVLVVDDGSTDGGADIACAVDDTRIWVITQPNGGVSAARNRGAAEARCAHLAFLDADDVWDPRFLACMAELIRRCPAAKLFGAGYRRIETQGRVVNCALRRLRRYSYINLFRWWRVQDFVCMSSNVFDREALLACGGFPVGVRNNEDWMLHFECAFRHPVAYCRDVLATYDANVAGQASKQAQGDPMIVPVVGWLDAQVDRRRKHRQFVAFVRFFYRSTLYRALRLGRDDVMRALAALPSAAALLPAEVRLYRQGQRHALFLLLLLRFYVPRRLLRLLAAHG